MYLNQLIWVAVVVENKTYPRNWDFYLWLIG